MVGMELDIDTGPIVSEGYTQGLILVNAGPNVLRFVPPLTIGEDEIKQVVAKVDAILQRM